MKQLFFKTLLFLYVTSSYLVATHIHSPTESHHTVKCHICTLVKQFQSADIPPNPIAYTKRLFLYDLFPLFLHYLPDMFHKGYFSTAPPLPMFFHP